MAKKGKNTILILAIVALAGYFFLKQSVRIDVGTPSVSFLAAADNGLRINVKLPVLNRSDFSYPIEGFLGQILYGVTPLGNVSLKKSTTIPARTAAELEFQATVQWGALATETYGVLKSTGVVSWLLEKIGVSDGTTAVKPVAWNDFTIRGTLYVGGVAMDINQKLT